MSVSGVGFYATATVLVAAALAVVVMPQPRHSLAATAALMVASAMVLAVAGAYVLAGLQLLLPGAFVAWLLWRRRGQALELLRLPGTPFARHWKIHLAISGAAGLLLLFLAASNTSGLGSTGAGDDGLIAIFHYRVPAALLVLIGLLVGVVAVAGLFSVESDDERRHDDAQAARRSREERISRRRSDREAARQRNRTAAP